MPEALVLAAGFAIALAVVLAPLRRAAGDGAADDRADRELRHRAALEALRDVEADRRSGTLDEAAYRAEIAAAEARAVETRRALDEPPVRASRPRGAGALGRAAASVAIAVGGALTLGSLIPASGIANATVVHEELAAAQTREAMRQERIGDLLDALATSPDDPELVSDLADAYLDGSTIDDLAVAATLLRGLIDLEPDRADAYERIITAYIRADDYANARAAHDAYAQRRTANPLELAFLDGLIALRGEGDAEGAVEAFDRFLAVAPDDPRAAMVRGLRQEAAALLDGAASPSP